MTTGDVVYSLRFSLIKILPEPGFDLGSTAGESCVLTARLHMLYKHMKYRDSLRPAVQCSAVQDMLVYNNNVGINKVVICFSKTMERGAQSPCPPPLYNACMRLYTTT